MKDIKIDFVKKLAVSLHKKGEKMNAKQLADKLNEAGIETAYKAPYSGMRGTYQLVKAVYERLKKDGQNDLADIIADTFVKYDGTHAWKNNTDGRK